MDYNSMLAEVDTLTADLRIKLNHDKEISRCSSVYSQVRLLLHPRFAERSTCFAENRIPMTLKCGV